MVRVFIIASVFMITPLVIDAQVRSVPDKESSNILKVEKYTPDSSIKIESITGFPDKSSLVVNRTKTVKAYVLCIPKGSADRACRSRVFFTNIKTGETFMISGEPAETEVVRPVSELKWVDNDHLSYERWMSPHFGRRYVVNARLKKQTGVLVMSYKL